MTSSKPQDLVGASTLPARAALLCKALQQIGAMPSVTEAERYFLAAKLRAVRTDITAVIKAYEAQK
jgi:hypothetical protein